MSSPRIPGRRPSFFGLSTPWAVSFQYLSEGGEWVRDVVYVRARTAGGALRKGYVEIQDARAGGCWRVTSLKLADVDDVPAAS